MCPIGYDPNREDVLEQAGAYKSLTVSTTAVELKVGATVLAARQAVTIMPIDRDIFWGYDSSVTVANGTKIFKGQFLMLPIGPAVSIYLIAAGSTDVRVGELS
jgi:hypothetical protein